MMKAIDILNAYVHSGTHFRIYLYVDKPELEDKSIILTSRLKKYEGCSNVLHLNKRPTRNKDFKELPCDIIKTNGSWFIDMLDRGYNIYSIDIFEQFRFAHFEMAEDETLIFVYKLDVSKIKEVE